MLEDRACCSRGMVGGLTTPPMWPPLFVPGRLRLWTSLLPAWQPVLQSFRFSTSSSRKSAHRPLRWDFLACLLQWSCRRTLPMAAASTSTRSLAQRRLSLADYCECGRPCDFAGVARRTLHHFVVVAVAVPAAERAQKIKRTIINNLPKSGPFCGKQTTPNIRLSSWMPNG